MNFRVMLHFIRCKAVRTFLTVVEYNICFLLCTMVKCTTYIEKYNYLYKRWEKRHKSLSYFWIQFTSNTIFEIHLNVYCFPRGNIGFNKNMNYVELIAFDDNGAKHERWKSFCSYSKRWQSEFLCNEIPDVARNIL